MSLDLAFAVMMKTSPAHMFSAFAFLFVVAAALAIFHVPARADQTYLPQGTAANYSAACSFAGATTLPVAVTGTSAKTASATGVGNARVVCTQDAYMEQGLPGVTGVTATTGSVPLFAGIAEYVNANRSTFAFVRQTANGTCYVTPCQ